ncbi:ZPR1 zinc finger domain-containing protein [Fervidicoccus fontis]|nr:ZPR1 zinc finger domain-containing protein [Fervidicoccus fontis]PMB76353.1 MAG: hypothetical protein C0177_06570 [Fervidicoccus fontis]
MSDKKIINEYLMDCPICKAKNSLVIREIIYDMPQYGMSLIVGAKCEKCGYRFSYIIPYEIGKKRIIELKIENERDLNIIMFIGENTDIEIPEIKTEILSSELDEGFVTTVEGLLVRIREQVKTICTDEDNCKNYLMQIDRLLHLNEAFTIKLHDNYGRTRIYSEKIKVNYE